MKLFDCTIRLSVISSCLSVRDVEHLAHFKPKVGSELGPRSEVIVSETPKREIQVKVKAFVHAAADVYERGIASIHLDVRSMMVKI